MKVGSLFAGIGGFDLGFERAGFTVAWHAEIDRAASAILTYRWPGVPNLGDVTKINGSSIEPVDVICGGFPCQDLSVAGKRAGFTGKRSVLAFEFLRIVAEMRSATNGRAPAFIVLENVPGLFSSAGGRDFGALLDALGELGPMDIAWRVLDSRYFGVAQRRRRVFVVVDFGGERCDEILALTEGLRGDSPTCGTTREDVAGTLSAGLGMCGASDNGDPNKNGALIVAGTLGNGAKAGFTDTERMTFVPAVANAVVCHQMKGGDPTTDNYVAFNWQSGGDCRGLNPQETTNALHRGQTPAVALAPSLTATNDPSRSPQSSEVTQQVEACLTAGAGGRRLTPRACERLQGFPDDWTAIPGMADGPRYKCLGNAVTVNVAEWLARRMV